MKEEVAEALDSKVSKIRDPFVCFFICLFDTGLMFNYVCMYVCRKRMKKKLRSFVLISVGTPQFL